MKLYSSRMALFALFALALALAGCSKKASDDASSAKQPAAASSPAALTGATSAGTQAGPPPGVVPEGKTYQRNQR